MKKINKDLILLLNLKDNIIMLFITENENLANAKLLSEKIIGNIFCESFFYKNICSILRKANLSSEYNFNTKIILPQEFFVNETIKIKNTFINNFFIKQNVFCNINNKNNYIINYKKTQFSKSSVYYDVCYIKKWIEYCVNKIENAFNLKHTIIISESCAETNFLKVCTLLKEDTFLFLKMTHRYYDLKLIKNWQVQKEFLYKSSKDETNFSTFNSICKSLALNEFYEKKQSIFERNTPIINKVIKQIELLKRQGNLKIVVLNEEQLDMSEFQRLYNNSIINFNNIAKHYSQIKNYEIIGALKLENINSLHIFKFGILNNIISSVIDFTNNLKLYFKNLFYKIKYKNKNIVIKLEDN